MPSYLSSPIVVEGVVIGYERTPIEDLPLSRPAPQQQQQQPQPQQQQQQSPQQQQQQQQPPFSSMLDRFRWWSM